MTKKQYGNDGLVWGIILIAIGSIFLIQKIFDVQILNKLWQFWPVLLIIWGIVSIKNARK